MSTIQYDKYTLQKPTYVAFVVYSTAYPSVHWDRLSSILLHNDIVGHMWHHLRTRIDKIQLRVLHPNVQEHPTVDILGKLPDSSHLGPTLFGISVADIIHELQTKFPHAVINLAPGLQHNGTTQIWIGRLLYVDDLALMSTCPRKLQAMLHVCQEWSVWNRMQINTQKTKVVAFFETPSLQKALVASTDPTQPYLPSTSTHPSQPPPLTLTSLLRYSKLYTYDSSSTPNSPCTSQLLKPFDVPYTAILWLRLSPILFAMITNVLNSPQHKTWVNMTLPSR